MNLRTLKKRCKYAAEKIRRHFPAMARDFYVCEGGETVLAHVKPRRGIDYADALPGTILVWEHSYYGESDPKTAIEVWEELKFWTPSLGQDKQREELEKLMEQQIAELEMREKESKG